MMKKSIISGLVIISMATASLMAYGPKGNGKDFGHKPKMMKVLKQIDLTDEQKETLKEMRMAKKEQRQAMREERKTRAAAMGTYFSNDGFNKAAFIADATEKFQARIHQQADHMETIYNILDETQKKEFTRLMQEQ